MIFSKLISQKKKGCGKEWCSICKQYNCTCKSSECYKMCGNKETGLCSDCKSELTLLETLGKNVEEEIIIEIDLLRTNFLEVSRDFTANELLNYIDKFEEFLKSRLAEIDLEDLQ